VDEDEGRQFVLPERLGHSRDARARSIASHTGDRDDRDVRREAAQDRWAASQAAEH
jgi:hypothetical protein